MSLFLIMKKIFLFIILITFLSNVYSRNPPYFDSLAGAHSWCAEQLIGIDKPSYTDDIFTSCSPWATVGVCKNYVDWSNTGVYSGQVTGYVDCPAESVCLDAGQTYNSTTGLCEDVVKDCFDSYDDLDPFADGIQCTCDGDLMPKDLSFGGEVPIMSCDGVSKDCPPGTQKVEASIGGITVESCQGISVCDPLTDPNQCAGDLPVNPDSGACVSTDPNDPCLDEGALVDNNVPDFCPVGYYYDSASGGCKVIKKIDTVVDSQTGDTTQTTTTNNGGDTNNTTNYSNTTDTDTGDEKVDPEEKPDPIFEAPETTGVFDISGAESSLASAKTDFSNMINTIKSDASNMFSVSTGTASLPCFDFPMPYGASVKTVCLSSYTNFFDILATVLVFLSYIVSLMIILRN